MYDLWLSLTNQNRRTDGPLLTPPPEDKQNVMQADYTESVVGDRHTDDCVLMCGEFVDVF